MAVAVADFVMQESTRSSDIYVHFFGGEPF